ncbi:class II aldolase/adducin family protein [Sinomonas soli]
MAEVQFRSERTLIANACRVLAQRGLVDDILGHISLRVSDTTALVRCRGPHERGLRFTVAEDIHLVPLSGEAELPNGYQVPNELPLHLATLREDAGVEAVVHAHPPAIVTLSLTDAPIQPLVGAFNIPGTSMARNGVPVHPSSALIRTEERAADMLESRAGNNVCILRGHGLVATGSTVPQAVIAALSLTAMAQVQLDLLRAGGTPRPVDESDLSDLPDLGSAFTEGHVWRFLEAELEHAGLLLEE